MYSGPPGGVYYTNQGLVNHTEEQEGAGPSAYPSNVYFAGAEAAPPVFPFCRRISAFRTTSGNGCNDSYAFPVSRFSVSNDYARSGAVFC